MNGFVHFLGCSMLSTRDTAKDMVSIAQKAEYENQIQGLQERVSEELVRLVDGYELWRKKNATDLSYSDVPGRESLDRLDQSELAMKNKFGSSVFTEFLNRDICLKLEIDEPTVARVARLDAWI